MIRGVYSRAVVAGLVALLAIGFIAPTAVATASDTQAGPEWKQSSTHVEQNPIPTALDPDSSEDTSLNDSGVVARETGAAGEFAVGQGSTEVVTSDGLLGLLDGIIGDDERELIDDTTDQSAVVRLRIDWPEEQGVCSGTLIGEYHVLTAGHCVYDNGEWPWEGGQGWAEDIRVAPAIDGEGVLDFPYDGAKVTQMRTYEGWVEDELRRDDIALLTLDRRVGAHTGTKELFHTDDPGHEMYERDVTGIGYPEDPPDDSFATMWENDGEGGGTNFTRYPGVNSIHGFSVDVTGGQSGGPVLVDDQIVSIIAWNEPEILSYNFGPRITTERYEDFNSWMAADDVERPPVDEPSPAFESLLWDPTVEESQDFWSDVTPVDPVRGEELTIETTVRNVGSTAGEEDLDIAYFLSESTEFRNETTELLEVGSHEMPAPHTSEQLRWEPTLEDRIEPGEYYVHAQMMGTTEFLEPILTEWLDGLATPESLYFNEVVGGEPITVRESRDPLEGAITGLSHPAEVPADGEFEILVETNTSAGTVLELDPDGFEVTLDSEDAVSIDDNRIEFLDPDYGDSRYTITVDVVGGAAGETADITAWVNGASPDEADDAAESSIELHTADDEPAPTGSIQLDHPETAEPDSEFEIAVQTEASAGTVLEFDTDGFDLGLESEDAVNVEDNRIEFLDADFGDSQYTVTVTALGGSEGETLTVEAWVNGATLETADDSATGAVELGTATDTGFITGTVMNPDHESIADIDVEVVDPETAENVATTTTDEAGTYTMELPAEETYQLVVEADGFERFEGEITVAADRTDEYPIVLIPEEEGENELPEVDVTGNGNPATDTTGDGLLNDVTGDGSFSVFDVQALFENLDDETVQENAAAFNFSGSDESEVTIFDIQALFSDL